VRTRFFIIPDAYLKLSGLGACRAHAPRWVLCRRSVSFFKLSAPEADLRRRDACVSHRRPFRTGGRRRDRPQEVHLRSLGRDGEHGEPRGIARAKRDHPDHAQDLRVGQRGVRLPIRRNHPSERGGRRRRVAGGWPEAWLAGRGDLILRGRKAGVSKDAPASADLV
jgi:hypothetical protein